MSCYDIFEIIHNYCHENGIFMYHDSQYLFTQLKNALDNYDLPDLEITVNVEEKRLLNVVTLKSWTRQYSDASLYKRISIIKLIRNYKIIELLNN